MSCCAEGVPDNEEGDVYCRGVCEDVVRRGLDEFAVGENYRALVECFLYNGE